MIKSALDERLPVRNVEYCRIVNVKRNFSLLARPNENAKPAAVFAANILTPYVLQSPQWAIYTTYRHSLPLLLKPLDHGKAVKHRKLMKSRLLERCSKRSSLGTS